LSRDTAHRQCWAYVCRRIYRLPNGLRDLRSRRSRDGDCAHRTRGSSTERASTL